MNKMYMIKFSSLFIKDYIFTSRELLNYEVLIDELEKVVKISIDSEYNQKCFYDINEESDIIVEVKQVVNGDEIIDIDDYLITFTNKYDSSFFNINVNNKDLFCF